MAGAVDPLRHFEQLKRGFAGRAAASLPELARAEALLAAGNLQEVDALRDLAHRLHGTAGTFGLTAVSGAAAEVEDQVDRGADAAALAGAVRALMDALRRLNS